MGLGAFRFLGLSLLLISVGCIPPLANRVPGTKIIMPRMMVMPTVTFAYELDASEKRQADNKKADALFDSVNPVVQRLAGKKGGFPLPVEKIDACGKECVSLTLGLLRWGTIACLEIAAQMKHVRNYQLHSIAEWGPTRDYTPLRQGTGADYALFVVVRDLRETTGREVTGFLVGRYTSFKQVGVACVVDLARRQMVWCHAESDSWGDLRNPQEANRAVTALLSDLSP